MRTREPKPVRKGALLSEDVSLSEDLLPDEATRHAFIQAEADRAVAPYAGLLPPETIRAFRERAAAYLANDPQMARLLDAALPRSSAQGSTVRPIESPENAQPSGPRKSEKKP